MTTAPVLIHNIFLKIIVSMEIPSILFLPTSEDPVLVVRTSKEPSKKFLELHNSTFQTQIKILAGDYFLHCKSDS